MRKRTVALGLLAGMSLSSTAHCTLIDRGGGLIYDDVLNITWLADADLAATETFGVSGIIPGGSGVGGIPGGTMNWATAQYWIAAMNSDNYLGYNNWRLPKATQPDKSCSNQGGDTFGFNCTGSEIGHLFYSDLGGTAGVSLLDKTDPDLSLFLNIVADVYWTGSEYVQNGYVWTFFMNNGYQDYYAKGNSLYVWAVRDGDVDAPNNVPESPTLALLSLGLFGLVSIRRMKAIRF